MFKRNAAGTSTLFEPATEEPFDLTGAIPLEVPAGTMVVLDAANVHFSKANSSAVSRHAYTLHVVEGGKGVQYPKDNWLQTESYFRNVYTETARLYGAF